MQEFIEYLEKDYYINELTNFDKDKIQFLEKEKEQIMNDYKEGVNRGILYCNGKVFISKEEYYKQTYNQNKS